MDYTHRLILYTWSEKEVTIHEDEYLHCGLHTQVNTIHME